MGKQANQISEDFPCYISNILVHPSMENKIDQPAAAKNSCADTDLEQR